MTILVILSDSVTFAVLQNMGRLGLRVAETGPKSAGIARIAKVEKVTKVR